MFICQDCSFVLILESIEGLIIPLGEASEVRERCTAQVRDTELEFGRNLLFPVLGPASFLGRHIWPVAGDTTQTGYAVHRGSEASDHDFTFSANRAFTFWPASVSSTFMICESTKVPTLSLLR